MSVHTLFIRNDTIYSIPAEYVVTLVSGTSGPDTLTGSVFRDDIRGMEGDDTLLGLDNIDTLTGGSGDDTLSGGAGHDEFHFTRGFGHDTITDFEPGDTIWLEDFNIADSDFGFETLRLFIDPTSDTLRIKLIWNGVTEQLDVPSLARADVTAAMFPSRFAPAVMPPSTDQADTLFAANYPNGQVAGLNGDDTLVGTRGSQRLDGGAGDDLFYEWDGSDTLVGGPGIDTAIYAGTRASYRIGIAGDTVLVQGANGTATLTEVEALRFADTGTVTLDDLRTGATTESLVTLLTNGTPGFVMPAAYTGPLALAYQFTGTDASDILSGTARNDFVYLGTGDDAADMGAGDDIADGGTGSNFLTGGAGRDIFFIDGRSHLAVWSCITDFEAGEELALWGWQPGTSTGTWGEDGGVPGYTGATFYADIDGNGAVETAVTLSGLTLAQTPAATAQEGLLWFR